MNVILLGPPGAGKGTQARILVEEQEFFQIATGDLLRSEIEKESDLGLKVKSVMDSGGLVDDETMIALIDVNIEAKESSNTTRFIFDGFPRTIKQAIALDVLLQSKNMKLDAVIKLIVDDEVLVERVSGRYTCAQCGAGYHDTLKVPKVEGCCDKCSGTTFKRRQDDTEETVRSRLRSYHTITDPLTQYYKSKDKLFEVDGMAQIDHISANVAKIVGVYVD